MLQLEAFVLYVVGRICSNGMFEVVRLIQEGYSFVFFLLDFLFLLIGKQPQMCELHASR